MVVVVSSETELIPLVPENEKARVPLTDCLVTPILLPPIDHTISKPSPKPAGPRNETAKVSDVIPVPAKRTEPQALLPSSVVNVAEATEHPVAPAVTPLGRKNALPLTRNC